MCGAEKAVVEILGPDGTKIQVITLKESPGKKGYLTGTWDWDQIGWKTSTDITIGKYTAKFQIWPSGTNTTQDKYFYVFTQGCDEQEVLCAHNTIRAAVHTENPSVTQLDPFTWDDTLADHAQKWADHLQQTGTFEHDSSVSGTEGENIGNGYSSITAAVASWGKEKMCFRYDILEKCFNNNTNCFYPNSPNLSCVSPGDSRCVGHYTQIVWRNTKRIGCGMAGGYVVCRYSPPGNYSGQKPY
jgi:hypothetical protein